MTTYLECNNLAENQHFCIPFLNDHFWEHSKGKPDRFMYIYTLNNIEF